MPKLKGLPAALKSRNLHGCHKYRRKFKYTMLEGTSTECMGVLLQRKGCTQRGILCRGCPFVQEMPCRAQELNLERKHPGYYEEVKGPLLPHETEPEDWYALPNLDVVT